MRIVTLATTLAVAIAFVTFSASSSKADPMAGGTISGKVVDADGNPVEGAKVKVMHATAKPKKDKKENLEGGDAPKPEKPAKPGPVAEGVTDANGTFSFAGIAPGEYMVGAMAKEKGNAKTKVTVVEGETAEVTLELKVQAPKKPKAE
jgi:protocatechuate 3,4-dioxygenase beta subunit